MKTAHLVRLLIVTLIVTVTVSCDDGTLSEYEYHQQQQEEVRRRNAEKYDEVDYYDDYRAAEATNRAEYYEEREREYEEQQLEEKIDERICEQTGFCD